MKNFKELRQGLTEEKMPLSSRLYKQFKKDIDKIMKKHDAYVSDSNTKYTTISSPKPMQGGFKKDLFKLLGMTESFKPYVDKNYPRCVDFYIQFRGGKGDRITSEENKKDFEKATKMIDAYCKSNKIKQKPVYSTPEEGSSAYKVGLMIDKSYSKTSDYDDGKDLQPLYVALSKLKTAEDHGGGWSVAEPKGLGPVTENFRKLARHGMGTEQRKDIKVGTVVDFYDNNGNKREGKIIKVGQIGDGYTLKDNKDNKVYKFKFHDRFKAKELLKKKDKLSNIIKKNTIKKGKFAGYMTDSVDTKNDLEDYKEHEEAKGMAIKSVMDTYRNMWEEDLKEDDDGSAWKKKSQSDMTDRQKDMLKKEREHNLRKNKPTDKSKEFAKSEREKNLKRLEKQRNALALRKHKDAEHGKKHDSSSDASESNQFDTYKHLVDEWTNSIEEEMITYRVKKMQKPEEDKFNQSAKMMKLKITMNKGKDDTVIVMSGTKKKLRDFDAVARGKSSYGDPSTIKHFDEK